MWSLGAYAAVTYIAFSWAMLLRRGEQAVDRDREALAVLWAGQRLALTVLASILSVTSGVFFAVAAWGAIGFVVASVKGFTQ